MHMILSNIFINLKQIKQCRRNKKTLRIVKMQLDFKYELIKFFTKCKNRDIHVGSKIKTLSKPTIKFNKKIVVNKYSNGVRHFSCGFVNIIGRLTKIPPYYVYNVSIMDSAFWEQEVIRRVIMYWDTDNATSMAHIFHGVQHLLNIECLRNWDVSKVANTSYMFYTSSIIGCINAIDNWDVSNVTNTGGMFCNSVIEGYISTISNWNLSNVTNMSYMFCNSRIIGDLDSIANWNVGKVTDMSYMFCNSLIGGNLISIANWNVSNVKKNGKNVFK